MIIIIGSKNEQDDPRLQTVICDISLNYFQNSKVPFMTKSGLVVTFISDLLISVHLCPQLHRHCKFGEITTTSS